MDGLCRPWAVCYTCDVFGFLGDIALPDYRCMLAVGLVLGTVLAVLLGRRRGLAPPLVADGALAAAVGGLLTGRVVYAAARWFYFRDHLGEALMLWRGGVSAPGALAGAVGGILVFCRLRRGDTWLLLDILAPAAALLTIFAWFGCLGAGCGCGLETRPDQGLLWSLSAELPDLYGMRAPRVAVQALGAVWSGIVLAAVLLVGERGRIFPLWLFLHAGGGFVLGFLRGDLVPLLWGLALVQMADLGLALAGLALLALSWWRWRDGR